METPPVTPDHPHLERRFGLLQASALNMSNMVGVGPFITIPLLLSTMLGPQAMLGWAVAFLITQIDAMIWSELGAMFPGSGGSYVYLREGFGRRTFGRLMAFLFIWQFIISGPLEIASGYIGFGRYCRYFFPEGSWPDQHAVLMSVLLAAGVGVLNIVLLYRRITSIGKITVSLWIGAMLTVLAVIATGVWSFNPKMAFDLRPGSLDLSLGFFLGLGQATRIGLYDYFGYYDVCYIGEEVKNPGKVIPRSIVISLTVIALLYVGINLAIIGNVPWRDFVATPENPKPAMIGQADFIGSVLMERVYGPGVARVFTVLILWTCVASVFALLLGYSRIPFAAAQDGYFFRVFARLHPTGHFPHVSLLVIGIISIACCAIPLDTVIDALVLPRILIQFLGQVVAVMLLRWREPDRERPYKVWLYPLPNILAIILWSLVFVASGWSLISFALGIIAAGVVAFFVWSKWTGRWPFGDNNGSANLTSGTYANPGQIGH